MKQALKVTVLILLLSAVCCTCMPRSAPEEESEPASSQPVEESERSYTLTVLNEIPDEEQPLDFIFAVRDQETFLRKLTPEVLAQVSRARGAKWMPACALFTGQRIYSAGCGALARDPAGYFVFCRACLWRGKSLTIYF